MGRKVSYFEDILVFSRIEDVAYHPALPLELAGVHNVFQVSMLKYILDPSHILSYELLEIEEDAAYIEKPMRANDTTERVLRTKIIYWVKVLWDNHGPEEATWELPDQALKAISHLLEVRYFIWKTKCPKRGDLGEGCDHA